MFRWKFDWQHWNKVSGKDGSTYFVNALHWYISSKLGQCQI